MSKQRQEWDMMTAVSIVIIIFYLIIFIALEA